MPMANSIISGGKKGLGLLNTNDEVKNLKLNENKTHTNLNNRNPGFGGL